MKFKMSIEILQAVEQIKEDIICKEHNSIITHIDLAEKRGLCRQCMEKKKKGMARVIETIENYILKMKEVRRWRKTLEKKVILGPNTIKNMFERRMNEIIEDLKQKPNIVSRDAEHLASVIKLKMDKLAEELGSQPF